MKVNKKNSAKLTHLASAMQCHLVAPRVGGIKR